MTFPESRGVSRRQFLAATASLAGVGRSRALAAGESDFGGFTLGIQSYTFRKFNLEQALKRTQDLGLKNAEFYRGHIPVDSSPEKIQGILKLCAEHDVKPVAFGVEPFTKNHENNLKRFEFAQALGIKFLSADPDPDSFDSLDKLCDKYKIAIAIHPHGPAGKGGLHRWFSAEKIMAAVKDHNPLIGSCLDTGHLIRSAQLGQKLDPVQQIKVMGDRNFGIHLKDHDNKKKEDVVFGSPEGVLDVVGVLKALKDLNFKGYMSIEYEANPSDPSPDVQKCVAYIKESVKKLA